MSDKIVPAGHYAKVDCGGVPFTVISAYGHEGTWDPMIIHGKWFFNNLLNQDIVKSLLDKAMKGIWHPPPGKNITGI